MTSRSTRRIHAVAPEAHALAGAPAALDLPGLVQRCAQLDDRPSRAILSRLRLASPGTGLR